MFMKTENHMIRLSRKGQQKQQVNIASSNIAQKEKWKAL